MKRETVQCLQHILDEKDSKQLSRDDYREACELALVMLSVQPTRWGDKRRWCAPGAFNNVRWMAKLLYAPKCWPSLTKLKTGIKVSSYNCKIL